MNALWRPATPWLHACAFVVSSMAVGLALVSPLARAIAEDARPQTSPSGGTMPHAHGAADDTQGHSADDHHGGDAHVHAPVPAEYRAAHVPAAAWTSSRMITRGKEIYAARCAVCHGDDGGGKGPAAVALPLKPPDLRDPKMAGEMTGNYWFWRVSEGGQVEPFKSLGSVMPAWKIELSIEDRWAVIAYQHSFSGHEGPHVTSEHPEMLKLGADHQTQRGPGSRTAPASLPASSHRH